MNLGVRTVLGDHSKLEKLHVLTLCVTPSVNLFSNLQIMFDCTMYQLRMPYRSPHWEEWVLTQRSPSQSHDHPWRCFVINTITVKQRLANILVQIISCHFYSSLCSLHYSKSSFTKYLLHTKKTSKKTPTKNVSVHEQFLFSLSSTYM